MTTTPTGPQPEPAVRTPRTALAEIRSAEAARMLGLLDPTTLPALASQWISDGVEGENLTALARSSEATSSELRFALLAEIAVDEHLTFASTADARALHAQTVIAAMTTSPNPSGVAMTFSNNYTDELSSRISRAIGRVLRRR